MAVALVIDDRPTLYRRPITQSHDVILIPSLRGMFRVAFAIALIRGLQTMAFQTSLPTTPFEVMSRRFDYRELMDGIVFTSLANSKSVNKSTKELDTLQRERLPAGPIIPNRKKRNPPSNSSTSKLSSPRGSKKSCSRNQPKQRLMSIKSIRSKTMGELSQSDLRSLCNAIRFNRDESSLYNLETLERILLELEFRQNNVYNGDNRELEKGTGYLKRIHVFSMLTALSNEVRSWKRKDQHRRNGNKTSSRLTIRRKDVQRLVKVVSLLSELHGSGFIDSECYNKDVPSFATMIATEAARYEVSAIDAAFVFLDMVEKEDHDGNEEWDPRLIGAVLDALARYGRAEEAQDLLGRAMGVNISRVGDTISNTIGKRTLGTFSRKRLAPIHAGPCYNALLRSWSKRATILAQDDKTDNSMVSDSLVHARRILHDMPSLNITITNKTVNAVLNGYSALGRGSESEKLLMEIETLQSSSLSGNAPPNTNLSILDVGRYNTVLQGCCCRLDANNVVVAERFFSAMKKRIPLDISMANLTNITIIPPEPDYASYSAMINCYCDHGMAIKAEEVLNEMCKSSPLEHTISCFLPVIQALEMSEELDVPQRVLSLLERSRESLIAPSRPLYMAALTCMKQHGRGEEAEIILDKFSNSHTNAGPDMYLLVLRAWEKTAPKSDRSTASKRAERWFQMMQDLVNASLLPAMDVNAYNCLLNCYARAGEAEKAEELLSKMESSFEDQYVPPTSKSYSLVIKALSNSKLSDAVHRAWKILRGTTSAPALEKVKIYNSMLRQARNGLLCINN